MKTIILFLVSMVILSGCKPINGPIDFMGKGSDNGAPSCYVYYKAVVHVQYQNGEPCTTAFASSDEFVVYADSAGDLNIRRREKCSENNHKIKSYYFIIYKERNKKIIWKGDILLGKFNTSEGEWPEPFIEIVIPN